MSPASDDDADDDDDDNSEAVTCEVVTDLKLRVGVEGCGCTEEHCIVEHLDAEPNHSSTWKSDFAPDPLGTAIQGASR